MKKIRNLGWGGAVLLVAMAAPLGAQEVQYVSGSQRKYVSQVDEKNLVAEASKKRPSLDWILDSVQNGSAMRAIEVP